MKNFILELYSEEIPAKKQENAEAGFYEIFKKFFVENEVDFADLLVSVGPCRITIEAKVNPIISSSIIEIKGPKANAPENAIEGFCKSNMVSKDNLEVKDFNGVSTYFLLKKREEIPFANILARDFESLMKKYTWPKSMVWGSSNLIWVRPLRNILCSIGDEKVKLKFGEIQSTNYTFGHKFMAYHKIEINNRDDYHAKLKNNYVIVSRIDRTKIISSSIEELCHKHKIILNKDESLLREVAGLCEYPVILFGKIDKKFLALPKEVLILSMKTHQKYFTANNEDGNLAPYFIFATNLKLDDYGEIISGNERVLNARLSDALYFYNQDISKGLESFSGQLERLVFHKKLGSIQDKVKRIEKIAASLDSKAILAARLCKNDLVTEMVGEFPELQGIMGGYYAKHSGDEYTSNAIRDHYKPMGADDETPTGLGAIISIADKIDSLVSLYVAGERATGSKDPYALRRYCLGIIRTIIDNNLDLDIPELVQLASKSLTIDAKESDIKEIAAFFEERLKNYMKQEVPIEILNATIDFKKSRNILNLISIAKAFENILKSEKGASVISLYKRAKNISSDLKNPLKIEFDMLESDSEKRLFNSINNLSNEIDKHIAFGNYEASLGELLKLEDSLTNFFNDNLVNSDDEKSTLVRKSLLIMAVSLFERISNFGEL